jgi:hypothetical protein
MFVSLSGLPDMLFEPLKYVKSWLVLNRRSAINSQGPTQKQAVDATIEMKSILKIFYLCLVLCFLASKCDVIM